jgi:hypothetical protein
VELTFLRIHHRGPRAGTRPRSLGSGRMQLARSSDQIGRYIQPNCGFATRHSQAVTVTRRRQGQGRYIRSSDKSCFGRCMNANQPTKQKGWEAWNLGTLPASSLQRDAQPYNRHDSQSVRVRGSGRSCEGCGSLHGSSMALCACVRITWCLGTILGVVTMSLYRGRSRDMWEWFPKTTVPLQAAVEPRFGRRTVL